MAETIKLRQLPERLEELSYPISRDDAAVATRETTITYADGEGNLGTLSGETSADSYSNADDLFSELQNVMPVEAVGEPGQSDGDA